MDEVERYRRAVSYARGLDTPRLADLLAELTALLAQRRGEPDPDELLTLPDAAALAGLALTTLHTQHRRGRLALERRGRDWYITRRELGHYLATRDTRRGSYAREQAHEGMAGQAGTEGE